MSEQSSREIQLTGKQLIFLFMSAVVLLVVVFLLGVSVGRGVGSERLAAGPASGAPSPGDTVVPAGAPAAADDPVALSYPNQLTGRGDRPPPAPPVPADEMPPITPPGTAARPEVVEDVPQLPPAPPAVTDGWFVQVGAYRSRASADRIVNELSAKGMKAFVVAAGGLNRVRVGPFSDRPAADAAVAEIRKMGHNPSVQKEGQ